MQDIEVTLDGLAHGGEGVGSLGEAGGKRIFVQGGLPGERVRAQVTSEKKRYAKGRVLEVLHASPQRVDPPCALAERCGGCNWQHVSSGHQAQLKAEIAANQLRFVVERVDEVHASPQHLGYRRRARLHVQKVGDAFHIGFYSANSNEVVPLDACPVMRPELAQVLPWLTQLSPFLVDEAQIHLLSSQGQVLVGVSGTCPRAEDRVSVQALFDAAPKAVVGLEFRGGRQRRGLGFKTLPLQDGPGDVQLRCGPFDFAQAQDEQNRRLLELVAKHVESVRGSVLELYCGAGNLTRVLRGEGRRIEAWDDARGSVDALARWSQDCDDVRAHQGNALKALRRAKERGRRYELIVVDPPRTGLGAKVVDAMLALDPAGIVYVSCDPATLARDLKLLQVAGYTCQHAAMVDMMPMTSEIEMVVRLQKQR